MGIYRCRYKDYFPVTDAFVPYFFLNACTIYHVAIAAAICFRECPLVFFISIPLLLNPLLNPSPAQQNGRFERIFTILSGCFYLKTTFPVR
jgi:hypothetical protein